MVLVNIKDVTSVYGVGELRTIAYHIDMEVPRLRYQKSARFFIPIQLWRGMRMASRPIILGLTHKVIAVLAAGSKENWDIQKCDLCGMETEYYTCMDDRRIVCWHCSDNKTAPCGLCWGRWEEKNITAIDKEITSHNDWYCTALFCPVCAYNYLGITVPSYQLALPAGQGSEESNIMTIDMNKTRTVDITLLVDATEDSSVVADNIYEHLCALCRYNGNKDSPVIDWKYSMNADMPFDCEELD